MSSRQLRLRPMSSVVSACASARTRNGIQYVEHTEGDGAEMFKAVCKLGLEEMVSAERALSLRSLENLDQSKEPEGAGSNPSH